MLGVIWRIGGVILFALVIQACSLLQKKIDPDHHFETESGFSFQFPMSGEWYSGAETKGQYMVGKKPLSDGSSILAVVRHGPVWTPGGKSMTSAEMFEFFKKDIEKDSQGERVSEVKTHFLRKKVGEAECLSFNQLGQDNGSKDIMRLSNDGMICLHPKRRYQFIWMAISQRSPIGKPAEDLTDDENRFFSSLRFL